MNEYQEGFKIDNDNTAEWAVRKIKEEMDELKRLEQVIDYQIQEYQLKKEQLRKKTKQKTENLKQMLLQYFEGVQKKATKTQEKYTLPSGELVRKFPSIKYERDNDKLLEWLKTNKPNLVKVTEAPMWDMLKNEGIKVNGSNVITEDGEIIEGVSAVEVPETFEIKF